MGIHDGSGGESPKGFEGMIEDFWRQAVSGEGDYWKEMPASEQSGEESKDPQIDELFVQLATDRDAMLSEGWEDAVIEFVELCKLYGFKPREVFCGAYFNDKNCLHDDSEILDKIVKIVETDISTLLEEWELSRELPIACDTSIESH